MTRDEVIALAREAGIYYRDEYEFCEIDRDGVPMEMMAKFAALVAAAERERMIVEGWRHCAEGQRTTQYCGLLEGAVKAEREQCAKRCEEVALLPDAGPFYCAAAIRARGKA
jgi:hypothetical protein